MELGLIIGMKVQLHERPPSLINSSWVLPKLAPFFRAWIGTQIRPGTESHKKPGPDCYGDGRFPSWVLGFGPFLGEGEPDLAQLGNDRG